MDTIDLLKSKNLRITKPRTLILNFFDKINNPISAEELYSFLNQKDRNLNLSTVYRNLNTLVDNDVLFKNTDFDGISYFQLNINEHKHFITCIKCGKKVTIEKCPIDDYEKQIEEETGFSIRSHNFEFTGLCNDCKDKF